MKPQPACSRHRNNSVIRICPIEREDLDQLFALDQICFRPGISYSKAELNSLLRHRHSISCAAVDADNPGRKIVGFAIAEHYAERGRGIGHVVTIDVAPDQRRRGIGERLMQTLTDGLIEADVTLIRLEVAVDNIEAQAFYRKLGFRPGARIAGFYMGTLDAIRMERNIGSQNQPDRM